MGTRQICGSLDVIGIRFYDIPIPQGSVGRANLSLADNGALSLYVRIGFQFSLSFMFFSALAFLSFHLEALSLSFLFV